MTEIVSNLITCSGTKAHVLLILTMAKKREKHWEEVTEDKEAQGTVLFCMLLSEPEDSHRTHQTNLATLSLLGDTEATLSRVPGR